MRVSSKVEGLGVKGMRGRGKVRGRGEDRVVRLRGWE